MLSTKITQIHSITKDEILNSIRDIESNIASLVAKKNILLSRSMDCDETLKDQALNAIGKEVEEYTEQLNILKL